MIRKFELGDENRCSEIMIACVEQNLNYSGSNKEFMLKMSSPENILKKAGEVDFFVLLHGGNIVCTGVLDKNEIRTMFCHPDFQKMGHGKDMLGFLIGLAKKKGFDSVFLGASPEAEGFYDKFGFVKKCERNDYGFRVIDMEMKL